MKRRRENALRTMGRARGINVIATILLSIAIPVPMRAKAQAPALAAQPGNPLGGPILMVTLIDNPRVLVQHWTVQPGERTDAPGKTHTESHDVFVVQLTPGDIYINIGETSETGHQDAGKSWWLAAGHPHSLANVGKEPFDLIIVVLKEPSSGQQSAAGTNAFRSGSSELYTSKSRWAGAPSNRWPLQRAANTVCVPN